LVCSADRCSGRLHGGSEHRNRTHKAKYITASDVDFASATPANRTKQCLKRERQAAFDRPLRLRKVDRLAVCIRSYWLVALRQQIGHIQRRHRALRQNPVHMQRLPH